MNILLQLFITFFKIGIFTIGGGYAMIPLIQQEVVQKGWVNVVDIMDFIAISESTPGPFAVNISTFCGISASNFTGAVFATLGVILPSFLIILYIAKKSDCFLSNKYVRLGLLSVRAAIVGLIGFVIFEFMKLGFVSDNNIDFKAIVIFILLLGYFIFRKYRKKNINPITIILLSACFGMFFYGVFF